MRSNFSFQQCRGVALLSPLENILAVDPRTRDCHSGAGRFTGACCVECMSILGAHFFSPVLSGLFSGQWSEKLPLSFSATSLTSSPVCLRAICYASPLFIRQALAADTVTTNRLTPQGSAVLKTSSLLPQQGDTFKNSNSCIACACLWKTFW